MFWMKKRTTISNDIWICFVRSTMCTHCFATRIVWPCQTSSSGRVSVCTLAALLDRPYDSPNWPNHCFGLLLLIHQSITTRPHKLFVVICCLCTLHCSWKRVQCTQIKILVIWPALSHDQRIACISMSSNKSGMRTQPGLIRMLVAVNVFLVMCYLRPLYCSQTEVQHAGNGISLILDCSDAALSYSCFPKSSNKWGMWVQLAK